MGVRQNACFERVQVLDSSMGEIVGMFVSLTAQGMGCWCRVLLGSCWLGENDSWSQKEDSWKILNLSSSGTNQKIPPATGFLFSCRLPLIC